MDAADDISYGRLQASSDFGAELDSIIIATNRWAIRFARSAGGGIDFLAADINSTNQLDANLFYLVYNGSASSSGTAASPLIFLSGT